MKNRTAASARRSVLKTLMFAMLLACPGALPAYEDETIATGFELPIYCTAPRGDYKRLFVLEKVGRIRIVDLRAVELVSTSFLNLTDRVNSDTERGLLGLAFHPDYMENGIFFVHYVNNDSESVVSRFTVDASDPDLADEGSETELLVVTGSTKAHQAGHIEFGPDGYLYVALGDNQASENAQDLESLRGKILRIDVNDFDSDTYAIPDDNPFAGASDDTREEIWALGLRNPYRFCFDAANGDMYIGDVGEAKWEEVHWMASGDSAVNFGWPCMDGLECAGDLGCKCSGCACLDCPPCPSSEHTDPIEAYDQTLPGRCAMIGGRVYRGDAIPDLDGTYFYSDWCSKEFFTLVYDGSDVVSKGKITDLGVWCGATGYGEDAYGEMYAVNSACESLWKLLPEDIEDRDCNGNFIADDLEIGAGEEDDCDDDGVPDSCEIDATPGLDADGNGVLDACEVPVEFVRGDGNGDASIGLSDVIYSVSYLFAGGRGECLAALDTNSDGVLDISDPIRLVQYLFLSGAAPKAPFPDCGLDSATALECEGSAACN